MTCHSISSAVPGYSVSRSVSTTDNIGRANFSVEVIDKIASSFGNNLILNTKEIIGEYNKLAKKFGRTELIYSDPTAIDDDLPF